MKGQTNPDASHGNPFADPTGPTLSSDRDLVNEATLALKRDASFTLTKDSLIVLDDSNREQPRYCGLISAKSTSTYSIPYLNVLSVTLGKTDITIQYAKPTSAKNPKSNVFVQTIHYELDCNHDLAQKWTTSLEKRAYGPSLKNKRIKVLINPYGGTGKAATTYRKYVAPIFAAAGCMVDVQQTQYMGHATEIAEQIDINAYDVLACASGDGLPFEVFNGLGQKSNASEALRKIAVVQLPCGTGNALSWNLNGTGSPSLAAVAIVKGVRTPLDLVSITQGNTRTLSFLSQSVGIVAESDLGTDNIRWMGDFRFIFGFLVRLLGQTLYPIDVSVKTEIEDKLQIKMHYAREMMKRKTMENSIQSNDTSERDMETPAHPGLPPLRYGTVNDPLPADWDPLEPYLNLGNFYCGNMCYMAADAPFFPASLPNDGLLDLVTIDGDISRLKAVGLLLDVENNTFLDQPLVRYRKISGVRVVPRFGWEGARKYVESEAGKAFSGKEGCFAADGEKLPFEPFQIEVHPGLGTVLSRRWGMYEFEGPKGWDAVLTPAKDALEAEARPTREGEL